ncbi:GNAT family N-acetyltransferase [Actinotalea sp. Marseille-Q4924]|uniref:GNAT family N-acetyltransferase n=1 Tax=Actinotalea sp. Marseille-Q4924 TaxID=2866571 RepID=UPI001CE45A78|nr:GNAT family protein [Actinotalea sp. Marseille-Q4924]
MFTLPQPTLHGDRVLLRPFTVADADAMLQVLSDRDVLVLTGSTHRSDTDEVEDPDVLVQWYGTRAEQTDRLDLAVVDRSSGVVVGEVVLNELQPENRSSNVRILVGPAGRGRGLGTEALRLVLDHAFRTVGLHRVELEVLDFNPRARHVYEQLGFVLEGTRREAFRLDGAWADAHTMAILEQEWVRD